MRILLVARDKAPSEAFTRLCDHLRSRSHEPSAFLGNGKPFATPLTDIAALAGKADIVLTGMSSSAELAEPEIAAATAAAEAGVPFGFYGDRYGAHERAAEGKWFAVFRQSASFFFALNKEEALAATGVFKNARCVATGNPVWEDFAFPKFTRAEVRDRLGVDEKTKVVLAPGSKSPVVNILVWGLLIEACANIPGALVLLAPHPGDRACDAIDPAVLKQVAGALFTSLGEVVAAFAARASAGIYTDLVEFAGLPVRLLGKDVKTSDLLPGADLVAEWGSTIGIEAAHLRIPIVSISTRIGRKRLASISGSEEWELSRLGVAEEADVGFDFLSILNQMFNEQGIPLKNLRDRQEEVFPVPPTKGAAVAKMAAALESLVAAKK